MQAILDLTLKDLESYLKDNGFPVFAAGQIFSWIYQKGVYDFTQMTDLSKDLRNLLKHNFYTLNLNLLKINISSDRTEKFLFGLYDRQGIESVLIPTPRRLTVCISTQAGCKFACRFCASGAQGWQRDLTSAEIIQQVIFLKDKAKQRINNLVFMGIGEPLDNYDNVLKAIRILNSSSGLNIGIRRMTISTCGLIPGIKRLAEEKLQIELSISLHAGDNQTRSYLMPINKKYPLEKLISYCRNYFKKTKRQITFEYILLKGINTDLNQARKLIKLLSGLEAKVNLIPVSRFKDEFSCPLKLEMLLFKDLLLKAGIPTTIRQPRGADIQAACGQLRLNNSFKRNSPHT
ncbi:MAG: 23S rRNA (adenine(2503)-C(2))-methyltransferase RlmN [Candidatus Omnitrophota bacterium]|jgi:23S rRNA (adenine2503-C2)-methyltransferase